MRLRTLALLAVVVVALGGGAAVFALDAGSGPAVTERWVSDTGTEITSNHHAVAAGRVDGHGVVYAPISGPDRSDQCGLVALYATNGTTRWTHPIPPANCTIHSVADPALVDYDADGTTEVLASTTTDRLLALSPRDGRMEYEAPLSDYGYTEPLAADFDADGADEIAVVDVRGAVFVLDDDGSVAWRRALNSTAFAPPQAADFTGDGTPELAVGVSGDRLVLFDGDGSVVWDRDGLGSSVGWTAVVDDDAATELVVATTGGDVGVIDGATGATEWRTDVGRLAAVHAVGDGDGDGDPEVYAVALDQRLRAFDAATGELEWKTTISADDNQMTPPPALGDLDGDGGLELVAAANGGDVVVLDAATGGVLGTAGREQVVYTHPTLADTDGDGDDEAYVTYGDGRVVAIDRE
jgi:outer membrane protein assembly factor BamB